MKVAMMRQITFACVVVASIFVVGCGSGESKKCGNGSLDSGEQCDKVNLDNKTCQSLGYTGGTLACDSSCRLDKSQCTGNPCGNGTINEGEDCDGTNLNSKSCQSLGYTGGTLACDSSCHLDKSQCIGNPCGNGKVDEGEDCDGANLNKKVCSDIDPNKLGRLTCDSNCKFDLSTCVDPDLIEAFAQASAQDNIRCYPLNELVEPDYATMYERQWLGNFDYAANSGGWPVDAKTLSDCISVLSETSCDAQHQVRYDEKCKLAWSGIRKEGEPCVNSRDCEIGGYCAQTTEDGCRVCRMPRGNGQICDDGTSYWDCQDGLYCGPNLTCDPLPQEGDPCYNYYECAKGLFCDSNDTCAAATVGTKEGDSCTLGYYESCGYPYQTLLTCQASTCVKIAVINEGQACDHDYGARPCLHGETTHYCHIPQGATEGTCEARPGVGGDCTTAPCNYLTAACVPNQDNTKTCQAIPQPGQPCLTNGSCGSSQYSSDLIACFDRPTFDKVCRSQYEMAQTCIDNKS